MIMLISDKIIIVVIVDDVMKNKRECKGIIVKEESH